MMTNTIKKRLINTAVGLTTAVAILGTSVAPAQAFHEVIEYKLHAWECLGLLITDPARHLEECGVSDRSGAGLDWGKTGTMHRYHCYNHNNNNNNNCVCSSS